MQATQQFSGTILNPVGSCYSEKINKKIVIITTIMLFHNAYTYKHLYSI